MKKVVFTVIKVGKENVKTSGVGYITDTDLVTAQTSKAGKPYIRVYEDCLKYCHQVPGTDNEYKGAFWELYEIDRRTVNVNYYINYKFMD
ncbi:MAG: hypothetical protein II896_06460 [Clostridia bacterium]|nr:hypothetical protein [Clostridia bacterium]